jgi:hypothetical protein
LVILQAALSFVLLVAAGLFAQSLSKLQRADLKLDAENRYILHINPQAARKRSWKRFIARWNSNSTPCQA